MIRPAISTKASVSIATISLLATCCDSYSLFGRSIAQEAKVHRDVIPTERFSGQLEGRSLPAPNASDIVNTICDVYPSDYSDCSSYITNSLYDSEEQYCAVQDNEYAQCLQANTEDTTKCADEQFGYQSCANYTVNIYADCINAGFVNPPDVPSCASNRLNIQLNDNPNPTPPTSINLVTLTGVTGAPSIAPRHDVSDPNSGRCGRDFDDATCDPNGAYGACCSQYGYCGSTDAHCLVGSGCQSGCSDGASASVVTTLAISTPSPITLGAPTSASSTSLSVEARPDGRCGRDFDGATCDPNGSFGGCCSQYGYCGHSDAHCGDGCQSGCNDGSSPSSVTAAASAADTTLPATPTDSSDGTPTHEPTVGSYLYQGCFNELSGGEERHALSGKTYVRDDMTLELCANFCYGGAAYEWFGVSNGNECYCGHAPSLGVNLVDDDTECSTACSGDGSECCGGPNTLDMYRKTDDSDAAPTTDESPGLPTGTPSPSRDDSRCGRDFDFAVCDPEGPFGGCCSSYGYCGADNDYCSPYNGCQSGCDGDSASPTTTDDSAAASTTDDYSSPTDGSDAATTTDDNSSPTSEPTSPPRDDGRCGADFGDAACDPDTYGACCSQYGYCGSSEDHCSIEQGCQSGCDDESPSPTTTDDSSWSTSEPTSEPTSPPRDDGRCGTDFDDAICDPEGEYGGCCSREGFCGTHANFCSRHQGCQSGCWPVDGSWPTDTPDTTPRDDGRCGWEFDDASCDPEGEFGGCCSQFGYCGSEEEDCSCSQDCQSGCWDDCSDSSTSTHWSGSTTRSHITTGTHTLSTNTTSHTLISSHTGSSIYRTSSNITTGHTTPPHRSQTMVAPSTTRSGNMTTSWSQPTTYISASTRTSTYVITISTCPPVVTECPYAATPSLSTITSTIVETITRCPGGCTETGAPPPEGSVCEVKTRVRRLKRGEVAGK